MGYLYLLEAPDGLSWNSLEAKFGGGGERGPLTLLKSAYDPADLSYRCYLGLSPGKRPLKENWY